MADRLKTNEDDQFGGSATFAIIEQRVECGRERSDDKVERHATALVRVPRRCDPMELFGARRALKRIYLSAAAAANERQVRACAWLWRRAHTKARRTQWALGDTDADATRKWAQKRVRRRPSPAPLDTVLSLAAAAAAALTLAKAAAPSASQYCTCAGSARAQPGLSRCEDYTTLVSGAHLRPSVCPCAGLSVRLT